MGLVINTNKSSLLMQCNLASATGNMDAYKRLCEAKDMQDSAATLSLSKDGLSQVSQGDLGTQQENFTKMKNPMEVQDVTNLVTDEIVQKPGTSVFQQAKRAPAIAMVLL